MRRSLEEMREQATGYPEGKCSRQREQPVQRPWGKSMKQREKQADLQKQDDTEMKRHREKQKDTEIP